MPKDLGSGSGKVNSAGKNQRPENVSPKKAGDRGGLVKSAAKSAIDQIKMPDGGKSSKAPLD